MPEPLLFICARATAPLVAAGSTFDQKCSRCKNNLVMAPSGREYYSEHPEAILICEYCVTEKDLEGAQRKLSPKMLEEIRSARPNTWRDRN